MANHDVTQSDSSLKNKLLPVGTERDALEILKVLMKVGQPLIVARFESVEIKAMLCKKRSDTFFVNGTRSVSVARKD